TTEFRKSLTRKAELAAIEALLAKPGNVWRDRLARWKLTGTTPMMLAAKPRPDLIARSDTERDVRVAAELSRLEKTYGVTDAQEAIRRYRVDYDAATAALERAGVRATASRFLERPPLTLDPELDFKLTRVGPEIPLVATTFDSMTSATTGIAV